MQTQHTTVPITSQDIAIIGKLCLKENPELAKGYLTRFREEQAKALDDDTTRINWYFYRFCHLVGVDPFLIIDGAKKKEVVDNRRLYVAVMLRMYKPQIFTHDIDIQRGLAEKLCGIVFIDEGNMSKIIDEVKVWYKFNQDDYYDKVQSISQKLIEQKNGYASNLFTESEAA